MLFATLYWKGHSIVKSYLLASGSSVSQIGEVCTEKKRGKEITCYPQYEGKKNIAYTQKMFNTVPKMTSKETQSFLKS